MKDLTNKKILNIFTICMIIFLPLILNVSFYLQINKVIRTYSSINTSMIIWFCIPFLFYVYIKDIIDKKRKLDIYDYIFYVLIITGIIVSIFAIYPKTSIVGVRYRNEGFLSLLGYYLLFINWKVNGTKEDIKKYIKIFIVIGIINSIYAFLQIYTPSLSFILRYTLDRNMASGISGNPNFFGALMVMILGILSTKFLISEKVKVKEIIIIIFFLISLINSQSTGPILTYGLTIIFMSLFLTFKKQLFIENIIVLILMVILSFVLSYTLSYVVTKIHSSNNNSNEVRCELCDIKQTVDSGGNGRLEIWQNTLGVIEKHPIIGVGYDNLGFAYPNPDYEINFYISDNNVKKKETEGIFVDNAHNVYLHTLATSGIVGLIPVLILLLYTFIRGLKSSNKYTLILLGGFVAYSIQAFANISVIEVASIYYLIVGLILSDNLNKDKSLT